MSDDERYAPDPEVVADLQLRSSSEYDRGRSRGNPSLTYQRPVFVATWPCRHPRCPERVPVTQDTVDQLETFNGYLTRREERHVGVEAVVVCFDHSKLLDVHRVDSLQKRHARLNETIRAIKASNNPRSETELIKQLNADHHPDVDGLLSSLTGTTPKKRRQL